MFAAPRSATTPLLSYFALVQAVQHPKPRAFNAMPSICNKPCYLSFWRVQEYRERKQEDHVEPFKRPLWFPEPTVEPHH